MREREEASKMKKKKFKKPPAGHQNAINFR